MDAKQLSDIAMFKALVITPAISKFPFTNYQHEQMAKGQHMLFFTQEQRVFTRQEQARKQRAITNLPNMESTNLNQEQAWEQSKVTTCPYIESDSTMANKEQTSIMNHTIVRKFEMLARTPMLYTFPFTCKQVQNISRGDFVLSFTPEQVLFLHAYNPTVRLPTEFKPKRSPPTKPKPEL